jgi:hypothetical protein
MRTWTTLWDRQNRRVLILAGPKADNPHWGFVEHDPTVSLPGIYDIWRSGDDIVFVEVRLDDEDNPRGFPRDLLDDALLGSQTIWPCPDMPPFIWWHP